MRPRTPALRLAATALLLMPLAAPPGAAFHDLVCNNAHPALPTSTFDSVGGTDSSDQFFHVVAGGSHTFALTETGLVDVDLRVYAIIAGQCYLVEQSGPPPPPPLPAAMDEDVCTLALVASYIIYVFSPTGAEGGYALAHTHP